MSSLAAHHDPNSNGNLLPSRPAHHFLCCWLLLPRVPVAALPSEQQPPPSAETTTQTLDYHGKHEPLLTSSLSSLANHASKLQPFSKEPTESAEMSRA